MKIGYFGLKNLINYQKVLVDLKIKRNVNEMDKTVDEIIDQDFKDNICQDCGKLLGSNYHYCLQCNIESIKHDEQQIVKLKQQIKEKKKWRNDRYGKSYIR
jgi:hypothetical protein